MLFLLKVLFLLYMICFLKVLLTDIVRELWLVNRRFDVIFNHTNWRHIICVFVLPNFEIATNANVSRVSLLLHRERSNLDFFNLVFKMQKTSSQVLEGLFIVKIMITV